MWLPGATAGSLWSLGNVGSIVAVEHLGQGVGYSASQAALLIRYAWIVLANLCVELCVTSQANSVYILYHQIYTTVAFGASSTSERLKRQQ